MQVPGEINVILPNRTNEFGANRKTIYSLYYACALRFNTIAYLQGKIINRMYVLYGDLMEIMPISAAGFTRTKIIIMTDGYQLRFTIFCFLEDICV